MLKRHDKHRFEPGDIIASRHFYGLILATTEDLRYIIKWLKPKLSYLSYNDNVGSYAYLSIDDIYEKVY